MASQGVTFLATPSVDDPTTKPIEDELASQVRRDFIEAEHYRRISGVEERLLRALRMRRYEYDPGDQALINGIDIYIGLAALKSRAADSWINDIVLNSIDKPWTLKPEEIPDLPEWMKEQVVDALEMELQNLGAPTDIRQRAKDLKDAAHKYAVEKATEAVGLMEKKIQTQFMEGGFRECFSTFVSDLTTFPLAIIRSPVIRNEIRLEWDGNKLIEKKVTVYGMRRISPFDFYPSLNSTTTQDGSYIIERYQAQPDSLYKCLGLVGFNDDAIRYVLNQYGQTGYEEMLRPDYQRMYLEDKYHAANDRKTIDVIIRNGKIQGSMLMKYNVMVPDPQAYYETEVWTVNNRTIKAVLNPYPLNTRPIHATSFVKVPGALWGEGICDILRDVQRSVNSSARSIIRNMAFSSGPIGEVDVSRLGDGEIPQEIFPYKLYHVDPDLTGSGKSAFQFTSIQTSAPQLLEVMNRFVQMADDLSGIPAYVLGNPQVAGAGRTLGGLSLMMGNAAKGIKNVILNMDRDVMEPIVTLQYNINMKFDSDPDIKGDAQIIARGATGLLQRELAQAKMTEMLQAYLPFIQAGIISVQGAQYMIRESLKNSGMDVDLIMPDPAARVNQINTQLGQMGIADRLRTGSSAPQALDMRSMTPPMPGGPNVQSSPGLPVPNAPGAIPPGINPTAIPANIPTGMQ